MRIVFFGSGEFAVPSLRWLVNSPHEVVAVVTQPDRPAGRGKVLHGTPVAQRALEEGLAIEHQSDVNDPAFVEKIRALQPDMGIVIDFGQKILKPMRSVFPSECVNLHGSLLPKWRGAAPVARTILAGEKQTGVTVFRLVDRMDAGPILIQRRTQVASTETAEELHHRLARIGCDAIDATLKLHESEVLPPGEAQDESLATRAPKLTKAEGNLRFDEPAEPLALRCRAMWRWPGARCRYVSAGGKSETVTIAVASALPLHCLDQSAGTVTDVLTVATGAGTLEIHSLQPAGKRLMSWQEFVNGRHVRPGDRFETLDTRGDV